MFADHDKRPLVLGMALAATLTLAATGCGGGQLNGQRYRDDDATYVIGPLGDPWQPIELGQNDLAWRESRSGAIVQINATCDPFHDVPLTALTQHLLIGFTDRSVQSQQRLPMDGREALRSHVSASLDGVPRELLFYVLKKDDCVYDFALVAPPGEPFQRAVPAYERFVGGFTTEVTARGSRKP